MLHRSCDDSTVTGEGSIPFIRARRPLANFQNNQPITVLCFFRSKGLLESFLAYMGERPALSVVFPLVRFASARSRLSNVPR